MNKVKVLLLMAGEATRWKNHRGVPKHFAPVHKFGPTILHTIKLFKELAPDFELIGVVKDKNEEPYASLKTEIKLMKAKLNPLNGDADKIKSSAHLWNKNETTVIVWADSWLTTECVKEIVSKARQNHIKGWWGVSRWGANPYTGSAGSENFAHIIKPNGYTVYMQELKRIIRLYKNGTIERNGGWELYKALSGMPDDAILQWYNKPFSSYVNPYLGNASVIIDGSEDFDTPKDWDEWHAAWHRGNEMQKEILTEGLPPVKMEVNFEEITQL